ncbi:MAG: NrtA/SsuA/CpmA family ABC transporter substrate-binding protein [Magnetococcales bacterium]|nr:NrtA/SsuA/CpmA family ABC transporter substrate-binding protein [Magnetococcales bacterium]
MSSWSSVARKLGFGVLVCVVWVASRSAGLAVQDLGHAVVASGGGVGHPGDKRIVFDDSQAVVDIGIQPLWLPIGIITEVMKRDGILQEALRQSGAVVRFHPFLKGADLNLQLRDGKLEGGFGGDMPTITACVTDQVRVVALADLYFSAIVARRSLLLTDLRGRRIGYAHGSNAHHALLTALAAVGLSEAEVTLVPMEVNAMPQALEQGTLDAFSAWEPTPTLAVSRYGHTIIHRVLSSGYLYFTRAFAENHPDRLALLVAAEARALNWLERSEDHLAQAVGWWEEAAGRMGMPDVEPFRHEIIRLAHGSLRHLWIMPVIPLEDLTEDGRIGRATRFLRSLGKVPSDLSWETVRSCFRREVGEAILSAPVSNRLDVFSCGEPVE